MSDIRSDTIKRSDAIKVVHDYWKQQLDRLPKVQGEYGEVLDGDCDSLLTHNKELSTRIKAIPSADRPQGEWVATDDTDEWYGPTYKCNICGSEAIGGRDNYCYNCGARMKGADDE